MILKWLKGIGVSFLMTGSQVYGGADREVRLNELEHQIMQVGTQTATGTYGANTAQARPDVDGIGWFFSFDLLFWKARIGGTEYAYTDQDPFAAFPIRGNMKSMEFKWDWGVRVGLGINLDHDGWDLQGQYIWWATDGSTSTTAGLNSSVVPLRGSSSLTTPTAPNQSSGNFLYCSSAKSLYDLDYQSVEAELGRDYYISSTLSLRPFWGLKSAWIDQEQKTQYTGGNISLNNGERLLGLQANTVAVKDSCQFWGLGPRTGIDTRWYLGNQISLFGNASGALLWGNFDVDHKERYSPIEDARIHLYANRHTFSPVAHLQLGLRYDSYFHYDKHHIGIGLGFEVEYWWRQNQMLKIDDATSLKYERYGEDVAFYGATLDFKWDF